MNIDAALEGWTGGGALAAVAWMTLRIWAILRVQPLWSQWIGGTWNLIAAAASLALALALAPGVVQAGQWPGLFEFAIGAGYELLLGSVVGLCVALPGHAAIGAGWVSAEGLGLRAPARAFTHLWTALTLAMSFAVLAHHAALEALAATFGRWPPFSPEAIWDRGAHDFATQADLWADVGLSIHAATLLALALATPILLTRAVLSPALISALRAPQPGLEFDRAWREWVLVAACLVALGAAWATFPAAWASALG